MTFPRDGQQDVRVGSVMADQSAQAMSANYVGSLGMYAGHYSENVDATVYLALKDDVNARPAQGCAAAAVADLPNAAIRDEVGATAGRAAAIEQAISLNTGLFGFSVLIARSESWTHWRCPSSNGPATSGSCVRSI